MCRNYAVTHIPNWKAEMAITLPTTPPSTLNEQSAVPLQLAVPAGVNPRSVLAQALTAGPSGNSWNSQEIRVLYWHPVSRAWYAWLAADPTLTGPLALMASKPIAKKAAKKVARRTPQKPSRRKPARTA